MRSRDAILGDPVKLTPENIGRPIYHIVPARTSWVSEDGMMQAASESHIAKTISANVLERLSLLNLVILNVKEKI